MANRFPGMNPYLEDTNLWPEFHHRFVASLDQILRPGLPDRYHCQIVHRRYTVAAPPTPSMEQQSHQEDYIEIRERNGGRLVTLLDVVSPMNRTTQSGRHAYLEIRSAARDAGANVVEIDLVLQGQPMLDYSREGLPDWDYAVTVTRSTHPEQYEIYTATLQKRLPRFRLPLASGDRDMVLDLTSAFERTFEEGGFAAKIDYQRDPPAEALSSYAYRIWEREGRPHGRDKDHWYRAIADLRGEAQGKTPNE
jgi:hypothetical protein